MEGFKQKIHDLEIQVQLLQESNDTMHSENERLLQRSKTDEHSITQIMSKLVFPALPLAMGVCLILGVS